VLQHGLGLSYGQLGLLASVPLLLGGALELPLGLLTGRRRRPAVLVGGIVFIATVVAVAFARNFPELLAAFTLFYPASGAFVTLTQAALMDSDPDRHAQLMARWDLAGWTGALAGPLLFVVVLAAGGNWRDTFLVLAGLSAVAWFALLHTKRGDPPGPDDDTPAGLLELRAAVRWPVLRWLFLLEVANWLVDVLTGFAAVYLVDVAHASATVAALAVAARLAAGMAGDVLLNALLKRVSDLTVLRATAFAALGLFPAFLLAPGLPAKLAALTLLSAATAMWYPLLQARLYGAVPSGVAVTLPPPWWACRWPWPASSWCRWPCSPSRRAVTRLSGAVNPPKRRGQRRRPT
jgi:FSR family fosmidomycin resistance protein-like MFS transporter